MRKGTTPSLTFKLPFEVSNLKNAKVTLCQDGVCVEKYLCDCQTTDDTLTVRLTQNDTFQFMCNSTIDVQLRVVTVNGEALASDVFHLFVDECLDEEVIS